MSDGVLCGIDRFERERCDKKFGRVAVDQIDYRLCQIRQMDDVELVLKKRTRQYNTDEDRAGGRNMVALVFPDRQIFSQIATPP